MKKIFTLVLALLAFGVGAKAETYYLVGKLASYLTADEAKATATTSTPILIYLDGDNHNRAAFLACSTSSTQLSLNKTSVGNLALNTDVTDMLFYLEVANSTNGTYTYYIKAPNGQYISNKLSSGNAISDGATNAVITTETESDKAEFTITSTSSNKSSGNIFFNSSLYLNSQNDGFIADPTYINWKAGNGDWSKWNVYVPKIATEQVKVANVTYKLEDSKGNSLSSIIADVESQEVVGTTPTAPSSFENEFVALSTTTETIEESTTEIIYKATPNDDCPFDFADDYASINKWYTVKFNRGNPDNWTYNINNINDANERGYTLVSSAIDCVNDNSLWAFIGNPYAVHIVNKAAGSDMELHGCSNGKPRLEKTTVLNGEENSSEDWKVWVMQKSTNKDNSGKPVFHSLGASGSNYYYLNKRDNTLGTWPTTAASALPDVGCALTIAEVSYATDLFDNVSTTEVPSSPKWGELASITGATNDNTDAFLTALTTYKETPNATNYAAVLNTLVNYSLGSTSYRTYDGDVTATYKGSDGFVNIANVNKSGYSIGLQNSNPGGYIFAQPTAVNDSVNQMWLVTSPAEGKVCLFSPNAQAYIQDPVGGSTSTTNLSKNAYQFSIVWAADGSFQLYGGDGTAHDYLQVDNGYYINRWETNSKWTYSPVEKINLRVHAVGNYSYATICYPFAVTLSDGAGYTGTLSDDGNSLKLTSIGAEIPAGTPVVVVVNNATTSSITATINGTDTEASPLSSGLSGTYLPKTIAEDGELTLGVYDNTAGFYHWSGSIQNKAYLNSSTASSKGFAFSFGGDDPTGISEDLIREAVKELQGQRYNVQGQPVGADYKGIVIQGGKKYLQK